MERGDLTRARGLTTGCRTWSPVIYWEGRHLIFIYGHERPSDGTGLVGGSGGVGSGPQRPAESALESSSRTFQVRTRNSKPDW